MSELVDIGSRRLDVSLSGQKPPTVVFECGAGRTLNDWDDVRSLLGSDVSTFAYSRAGQGRSDPPDPANLTYDDGKIQVATAKSRTDDLESVLAATKSKPPYILVGHSLGGIYIRLFAARHPNAVAGLVFVDSSHPEQIERVADEVRGSDLSNAAKERFFAQEPSPNGLVIRSAEATGPFDDKPVVVLSRDPEKEPETDKNGPPLEFLMLYEQVWAELQADLLNLSSNSSQVVVKDAGHLIHLDSPTTVAQAVSEMIGTVRAS